MKNTRTAIYSNQMTITELSDVNVEQNKIVDDIHGNYTVHNHTY